MEVQVKNPEGVFRRTQSTSGKTFKFDEKCTALRGALLTYIAQKEDKVLVEYSQPAGGVFQYECPNKTLIFMSRRDYELMDSLIGGIYSIAQELEMMEVKALILSKK